MSVAAPFLPALKASTFAILASAILGVISGIVPLPLVSIVLFALYAIFGVALFMGTHGSKLRKVIVALIAAFFSVVAMWATWTWAVYGSADAIYFLTGGTDAIVDVWNGATQRGMSLGRGSGNGVEIGSGLLTTTAILTTICVAFPPLIWGLLAGTSVPNDDGEQ